MPVGATCGYDRALAARRQLRAPVLLANREMGADRMLATSHQPPATSHLDWLRTGARSVLSDNAQAAAAIDAGSAEPAQRPPSAGGVRRARQTVDAWHCAAQVQ